MDTLTPDGYDHEQQTRGGIQPVCMEMNYSTPERNREASNTTVPVDLYPQHTCHLDVTKWVEQSASDRGKGAPTANSRGRQDYPSPQVGGFMMSAGTASPKGTKKLRSERDVSLPRERARSKTRATKPHSDMPSI
jgi:hypothetical protein